MGNTRIEFEDLDISGCSEQNRRLLERKVNYLRNRHTVNSENLATSTSKPNLSLNLHMMGDIGDQ